VTTTEQNLPSVIVTGIDPDASGELEAVPSGDVDTLLEDIAEHANRRDSRRVQTLHSIDAPPARPSRAPRAVALAVLGAVVVAGALVGLRAHHVSPGDVRAALHFTR
jgi:hypothetical protein